MNLLNNHCTCQGMLCIASLLVCYMRLVTLHACALQLSRVSSYCDYIKINTTSNSCGCFSNENIKDAIQFLLLGFSLVFEFLLEFVWVQVVSRFLGLLPLLLWPFYLISSSRFEDKGTENKMWIFHLHLACLDVFSSLAYSLFSFCF